MRRALFTLAAAALAGALWLWPASAAERAAWLADFDRLERHTAVAYANLGDRLASRGLSPRALDERARAALGRARNRGQARAAVHDFVAAFEDAHFQARAPHGAARRLLRRLLGKDRPREVGPIPRAAGGEEACARLGARDRRAGPLDWGALDGFEPLGPDPVTHPFPAGVVRRAGRAPLAVLRIGLFSPTGFPQLCAAEWESFAAARPADAGDCGEPCREEFWARFEHAFLDRFVAELGELAAAGAGTLLVDLTGNGGGSEIVGPMTRALAAGPLPQRGFGFIRHPHAATRLRAMVGDFRAELGRDDLKPRQRELVTAALARAEAALREAETPCDLSRLWRLESAAELPCSNVGRSEPFLERAEPGDLDGLWTRELLDGGDTDAATGIWRGALYVAVDRRTASASEDMVASLQDAGAATLVGERTMGIGCGYTNGGVTLELAALGMTVKAPDCVRYRADGRNEAEGVLPDIVVDWSDGDAGAERAAKLIAALPF